MSSRTFPPQMSSSAYGQASTTSNGIIQLDSWSNKLASLSPEQKQSIDRLTDWLSLKPGSTSHGSANKTREQIEQDPKQESTLQQLPNGTTSFLNETSDSTIAHTDGPTPHEGILTAVGAYREDSTANFQALPAQPLADPTSFLAYYSTLTTHLSNSTKSSNEIAITQLSKATKETEDLLLELERVKVNLAELKAGIKAVEEADGLRERAEGMLERMDHLHNLSSSLSLRLSYFDILQPSTILLSSPSLSLVQSHDFLHMLDRLDVALAFVRAHPHYRDSNLYKMRFEGCLIRAGTLIKLWTTGKIKEAGGAVSTSMSQKDAKPFNVTSRESLIHSKFEYLGRDARVLISEVEKRAHPTLETDYSSEQTQTSQSMQQDRKNAEQAHSREKGPEQMPNPNAPEFSSLLAEIRASYLTTRKNLLLPIVQSHFANLAHEADSSKTNLLSPAAVSGGSNRMEQVSRLISKGFQHLDRLGTVERDLYRLYFSLEEAGSARSVREGPIRENEDLLGAHLEGLSEPLYAALRPKIQAEVEVESLARICLMLLELPNSGATLIKPILKEVQSRLLSRAQSICRTDIQDYKAKEGELDLFKRLLGTNQVSSTGSEAVKTQHRRAKSSIGGAGLLEAAAESVAAERNESSIPTETSTIRLFASPSPEIMSTWYPPLARLLYLLSLLHQKLPTSTFTLFATSSVNTCRASLTRDYDNMSQSWRLGGNGFDPPLFYLRHLFLLREMVTSVDLSARPEQVSNSKADWIEGHSGRPEQEGFLSTQSLSFSTVVDALNSLWSSTGALFYPRNFYDLAARATNSTAQGLESGTPVYNQAEEELLKKPLSALEKDIQRASTKFIELVAAASVLPLKMYLDHATVKNLQPGQDQQYLSSREISAKSETSIERAKSAAQGFRTSSESTLKEGVDSMRSFLDDDKIVKGILIVVLERIASTYSPFRKLVLATYGHSSKDLGELLPDDQTMSDELAKSYDFEEGET